MDVEKFRDFCLSLPHVTEHFPFDEVTLVFKIGELKLFALIPLNDADRANLKCDPAKSIELRERFAGVTPGFHMNKKHWNTILFNEDLSDEDIYAWIKESYHLVYQSLTKKNKELYPL